MAADPEAALRKRRKEAASIFAKFPGRVPVICSRAPGEAELPDVGQKKMLFPSATLCGQLAGHVLQHINKAVENGAPLWEERHLCVTLGGTVPPAGARIATVYEERKAEDLFMYATYSRASSHACDAGGGCTPAPAASDLPSEAASPLAAEPPSDAAASTDEASGSSQFCAEVKRIQAKYPGRVPAICERAACSELPAIRQKKFLLAAAMPCSEFREIVKKNLGETISGGIANQDLCLSAASVLLEDAAPMSELYAVHRAADGFLYLTYDAREPPARSATCEPPPGARPGVPPAPAGAPAPDAPGAEPAVPGADWAAASGGGVEVEPARAAGPEPDVSEPSTGTASPDEAENASIEAVYTLQAIDTVALVAQDPAGEVARAETEAKQPALPEAAQCPEVRPEVERTQPEPLADTKCPEVCPEVPAAPQFTAGTSKSTKPLAMLEEAQRMLARYPDRVPVLCERMLRSELPQITQNKLLVPAAMPCGELKYIIHREVNKTTVITGGQTIYLFVGSTSPKTSVTVSELYDRYKSSDGFLHVTYGAENTLGGRRGAGARDAAA